MYSGWYIIIAILVANFILFILKLIDEFKKDKDIAIIKNFKENGLTWGDRKVLTYSETDISDWTFDDDDRPRCMKCNNEALYCKTSINGSAETYVYRLSEYCPKCGAKMIEEELKEEKE